MKSKWYKGPSIGLGDIVILKPCRDESTVRVGRIVVCDAGKRYAVHFRRRSHIARIRGYNKAYKDGYRLYNRTHHIAFIWCNFGDLVKVENKKHLNIARQFLNDELFNKMYKKDFYMSDEEIME